MSTTNHRPSLRQRQALETRRAIVDAARSLFLERGYAATTVDAIAQRAGVAVSTVYAVFTSKRGVLRAIRESWHESSRVREILQQAEAEADPVDRIAVLARATVQQWATGADVIAIYRGAAATDAEAAAELKQALLGRQRALETFARGLAPNLREGVDVDSASALLRALTLPEVFSELTSACGWDETRYEAWLAETLAGHLLGWAPSDR